jgi:hypothetical protein
MLKVSVLPQRICLLRLSSEYPPLTSIGLSFYIPYFYSQDCNIHWNDKVTKYQLINYLG